MKFRYELEIPKSTSTINHDSKIFLIGSCFTENIATKLSTLKFNTFINPNGILFNPVSVSEALINVIENKEYTGDDLFELNEAWHSWQHHSAFSSISQDATVEKINATTQKAHEYLKTATHLIITLGSAWIYTLTSNAINAKQGTVAANNHKAPNDWFEKKLLRPDQVILVLATMLDKLGKLNPNIQIIFTISPVRHLREGLINNNKSKAVLILAVHEMIEKLLKIQYFPAYELVIDDLRDYRFFAEDLAHPNYAATEYVFEKFVETYCSDETTKLITKIKDINTAYNHKPFNSESKKHKEFKESYFQKIENLMMEHSNLKLEEELHYFKL